MNMAKEPHKMQLSLNNPVPERQHVRDEKIYFYVSFGQDNYIYKFM